MRKRFLMIILVVGVSGLFFFGLSLCAQTWRSIGPPGGDVRTLAAAPNDARILFLGTTDGHVFGSRDRAEHWELLGRVGETHDNVITSILVDERDPRIVFAGTWTLSNRGGAIYRSDDAGHTWRAIALQGQTVRALAQAASKPNLFFAGTLDGVYRSNDSGRTWERISPANHEELRNFDSLAVDPQDPNVIYAGTYHLPWKTTDGGRNWAPIHTGMIDDSDVMSVWIDQSNPAHVLSSACSGIYQSQNGGANWTKIRGIAGSAHRTHLIRLDPRDSQTVYAGTTQGLWRSANAGVTWQRLTPGDWSITGIVIDPKDPQRLVLGTERSGVELSEDGGRTFRAANDGFNHRQVVDLAVDPQRPERAIVVLTNSVDAVLATRDGGNNWTPLGPGLDTVKMRHVYAAPEDGFWASLSSGGLLRYDETRRAWLPVAFALASEQAAPCSSTLKKPALPLWQQRKTRKGSTAPEANLGCNETATARAARVNHTVRNARTRTSRNPAAPLAQPVVNDLAFSHDAWYAATDAGLLASRNRGATWSLVATGASAKQPFRAVGFAPDGGALWAVGATGLATSHDSGKSWTWTSAPLPQQGSLRLRAVDANTLLAATMDGLLVSHDAGASWQQARLPELWLRDAAGFSEAILAAPERRGLFLSLDGGKSWSRIENPIAEGSFPALVAHEDGGDVKNIWVASATEGLYAFELQRGVQVSQLNSPAAARPAPAPH
jgi:photosystem II stability/assembly factor-like uncharacterized protein